MVGVFSTSVANAAWGFLPYIWPLQTLLLCKPHGPLGIEGHHCTWGAMLLHGFAMENEVEGHPSDDAQPVMVTG